MEEHVLVAGATGLVGRAAMEHFARKGVRTTRGLAPAPVEHLRRCWFGGIGSPFSPPITVVVGVGGWAGAGWAASSCARCRSCAR